MRPPVSELDCGIREGRIVSWLADELSLRRVDGTWTFTCPSGSCRVSTAPLPNRELGKVSLERTLVRIEGDPAAIEEFSYLFTLRFISAGG